MKPSDEALLLHLPCNALEDGRLVDASPAAGHVPLPPGVELRPDNDLGRALAFAPNAQGIELELPTLPEWALTLAAWIRVDEATATSDRASILQYPFSGDTQAGPYVVFGLHLEAGKLRARIGGRDCDLTVKAIAPQNWHHVALTWDGGAKKAVYYLDGKPLPAVVEGQPVEAVDTGIGVLNYPDKTLPLLIGANAIAQENFSGRMAGLRVYGRALAPEEMATLVHEEKHATPHPFDHHHPLGFRVADDRGHPSVSIVEPSSHGRTLNLILSNTSPIAIELPPSRKGPDGSSGLVGTHRPTPDDHRLEVMFRPGTLDPKDVARISPVDTNWHVRGMENDDGTLSLLLSRPHGLAIPPGGVLTISLAHVRAIAVGGSRSTQVMLRYRHLRYLGDSQPLGGHRLAHLDVVNQRGRADPPFAAGFIGSNTVLNDGRTHNTLTLYLGNPALEPLSLAAGELQVRPRLILSFASGQLDENDEPWALGHADEIAEIEIAPRDLDWVVHEKEEGETPEWVILPPEVDLAPNTWINFTLYPIVTRSPSGFTNLYLRYQNVPGFRDGRLVVPIEKAPRLYRQQPVPAAEGESVNPDSRRSVHAFADSVVIGRGYASKEADDNPSPPPYPGADSLLVEGNVGIGAEQPDGKLHVNGRLRVDGEYYGWGHVLLYAYEGNGNSGTAYLQARDTSGKSSVSMQLRTQKDGNWVDVLRLTPEGNARFNGTLEDKNGAVVPIGTIVMWSNYQKQGIPRGWALCNGENGTPDLRGRFVVGHAPGGAPNKDDPRQTRNDDCNTMGSFGGEKLHSLTESEMPRHGHSGQTDSTGAHHHGTHYPIKKANNLFGSAGLDFFPCNTQPLETRSAGQHAHGFQTSLAGGNASHENRPPYYVLAYIIKIS